MLDGPRLAPASGGAPKQLVVLLHGYGSNGADLISLAPLWHRSLPDALFVAPDAPERCVGAPSGFQWWALQTFDRPSLAAGVARAAPALDAFLDAQLADTGLTADRMLLIGFSQGTMMALHVGPRRPAQVAGILGYSGMVADPATARRDILTRPPVLLIHGSADPTVPPAALGEAERTLKAEGLDVQAHMLPGLGHTVDLQGLQLGERFATRVLLGG